MRVSDLTREELATIIANNNCDATFQGFSDQSVIDAVALNWDNDPDADAISTFMMLDCAKKRGILEQVKQRIPELKDRAEFIETFGSTITTLREAHAAAGNVVDDAIATAKAGALLVPAILILGIILVAKVKS